MYFANNLFFEKVLNKFRLTNNDIVFISRETRERTKKVGSDPCSRNTDLETTPEKRKYIKIELNLFEKKHI